MMSDSDPTNRTALGVGQTVARNTALNTLGQLVPLAVGFLAMPRIIEGLGNERFGVLALTWVIAGYFVLLDFGLSRATTKYVAAALDQGRKREASRFVWSALTIQSMFGGLWFLLLFVGAPVLAHQMLTVPPNLVSETVLTFRILAVAVPVMLISTALRGVLEALQRFDLVNTVRIPLSIATFALPLLGTLLQMNLPEIVVLLGLAQLVGAIALWRLCRRSLPGLKGRPQFEAGKVKSMMHYGGWVMVSGVVGPILVTLDRFTIGSLVSVAAVGLYAAPYEVVTRLWIFPTSLTASLFPVFSRSTIEQDGLLAPLVIRSVLMLFAVMGPIIVAVVALAPDILQLWLGAEFAARSSVALQVLAVGVLVNSIAHIPFSLLQGLGRPDIPAKLHLAELPVHVLLVVVLVQNFGITGAALAWTIRAVFDALLLFVMVGKVTDMKLDEATRGRALTAVAVVGVFGFIAAGVAAGIAPVLMRFGLLSLCALGAWVVVWRYLLDGGERAQLGHLIVGSR